MASTTVTVQIQRDGAMCFIPVPFDPKPVFGKVRAPVRVTLNGYTFRSTIAAMGGVTCIPLRRSHREAAGLQGGETLPVQIALDAEARDVALPAELQQAFAADAALAARWQRLSYTHRREHVEAIEGAKKPATRVRRVALAIAALVAAGTAGAFELSSTGPDFTVVVPRLPAIPLEAQKATAPPLTKAMRGADGTYEVSLLVTQAERETSTRACAGTFLRALVGRPGMPERDSIYRAPLDSETFLVLYILGAPQRLHAHLLSSANASHCIELHVSKALRAGEDEDDWRKSFQGSHIAAGRR